MGVRGGTTLTDRVRVGGRGSDGIYDRGTTVMVERMMREKGIRGTGENL